MFLNLLTKTNNIYFAYIALTCFFKTFPDGRVVGWWVGNCDFNENPVVHLDLDFESKPESREVYVPYKRLGS